MRTRLWSGLAGVLMVVSVGMGKDVVEVGAEGVVMRRGTMYARPVPTPELEMDQLAKQATVMVGEVEVCTLEKQPMGRETMYVADLKVKGVEVLRGKRVGETGAWRVATLDEKQVPAVGSRVLAAFDVTLGANVASGVMGVDEEKLKEVRELMALPIGWEKRGEDLISPWAGLHDAKWPEKLKVKDGEKVCARTGRPGMGLPRGVEFSAKAGGTNEDGSVKGGTEGSWEVTVTLKNTGKEAVELPMVLKKGEKVLWGKVLVIYMVHHGIPGKAALILRKK